MNDKDAKKLERLTERYKKNNEKIKQNYDRVSIALPKGTKDRIKATGDTLNNFIINAVMERLKAAEADLQEGPDAKPQEAPQDTPPGAHTNRHEATKSATEGRTEAQEPKPRGRSKKASATPEGPEEGTTAGSPEDAQPVEAADAPRPINPGDNLQDFWNPYAADDIPPEELPFH